MRALATPTVSAATAFSTATSRVRDPDLKERLAAVALAIAAASLEIDQAGRSGNLHAVAPARGLGAVTHKEMTVVYEQRFARAKSPGRPLYDELITAPTNGICPLCGHGTVSTLDHFLAASAYSRMTIVPLNLVPACSDCNKAKGSSVADRAESVTLHPYFDNVENDRWLEATVVTDAMASTTFAVRRPAGWSDLLTARVRRHFEVFGLGRLYNAQASEELAHVHHQLTELHAAAGSEGVADHLKAVARSRRAVHLNSWQSATYRAWSRSEWFCDGGFATLA